MDYIKAFLIGGLICAAVQILLDRTKLMPGRVMVLLVCTAWIYWSIRTICKIFRSRCKRSTAWIRKCPVERCEGSC